MRGVRGFFSKMGPIHSGAIWRMMSLTTQPYIQVALLCMAAMSKKIVVNKGELKIESHRPEIFPIPVTSTKIDELIYLSAFF